MSIYVLVHGAFMGSWFWQDMAQRLRRAGHRAEAPDLPSQGEDPTPVSEVGLDSYVARVVEVIDRQPEPVVLVGHSLGGLSISQAAEERPDRIKRLVYVGAFLLPDGSSPRKFYEEIGEASPVMAHSTMHDDGSITFHADALKSCVFNTSPDWVVEEAKKHLKPTPRKPMGTPLRLTDKNYGRVPRVYVETLRDNAIPNRYQKMMLEKLPCERVFTLDCDHSPQFSMPDELERILLSLA